MDKIKKHNRILLFSGGVDSYVAWHYLGKPQTVYFNLGGRYSERELDVVREMIPATIIDNSLIGMGEREYGDNAYIPFRNMLLAAQAVKYSNVVCIAGLADDMVNDKNEEVFGDWSCLFTKMEETPITIASPFWHMTKADVVGWYLKNCEDHAGSILYETISCYNKDEETNYCGKCNACFRKWVALGVNGLGLPFYDKNIMGQYYMSAKRGKYLEQRNENIIKMVRKEIGRI